MHHRRPDTFYKRGQTLAFILDTAVGQGVCGAGLTHQTGGLQKRNLKLSFNNLLNKLVVNCGF